MLIIRAETEGDVPAVHEVNERAFNQADEANLVEALRKNARPYLSLLAELNGQVVGHIFFSPVLIESAASSFTAMGLGPMAVLPEQQNQGIGSELVRRGLKACQSIGHDVVVVVGHPEYYPRFGFVTARDKGLTCEYAVPDEAFMVAELKAGALAGRTGLVRYRPEFDGV
jgi:putative acetyltransferase